MKKKILIILTGLFIFAAGSYFNQKYFYINNRNTEPGNLISLKNKEVLPPNFVSSEQLKNLKVGDEFFNPYNTLNRSNFMYILSKINEPVNYPDGSSGNYRTFEKNPDYYGIPSMSGSIEYSGVETDKYFFHTDLVPRDLPIPYSKNDTGYDFSYPTLILLNHDSGKFLYKYWSSKGVDRGTVYIEGFDMLGSTINNLKVNPVSTY